MPCGWRTRHNGRAVNIAVTGSTGLIGSALIDSLRSDGHEVHRIVRSRPDTKSGEIGWDPVAGEMDAASLAGIDAVVHLAGENVGQRWTEEAKRKIRDSRVDGTHLLAETIASLATPPRVLVSASAVGVYGDRGDEPLTEDSPPGNDFLAEVAREWEAATEPAANAGVRVVHTRFGVVLSSGGGALERMLPPFRLGAGGKLGSGKQWMSWIALPDVVAAIRFAVDTETLSGPVNVTAPNPVRNTEFTDTLGKVLGRPTLFTVPAFALRLAFGEMADAALLTSQRVIPERLAEAGFGFQFPELKETLRAVL